MTSKKKLGLLGLGAVALVGGTFAYFTQTATIDNPFDTAKYGTVVYEDFKPQDGNDWQPGAEVNKDLYVTNTGDRAVVVRVKFEDFWKRNDAQFHAATPGEAMTVYQEDLYDGLTDGDKSVVHKYFANTDKWSTLQEDGYYYYLTKLEAGADTDKFLDSVRLDAETDMGKFMTQYYYTTAAKMPKINPDDMSAWEKAGEPQPATASQITPPEDATFTAGVTKPEESARGYSEADYVLRITVETVQATDKAVATVFDTAPSDIVEGWTLDKEDLE